jgi:uncharacterized membrane protein
MKTTITRLFDRYDDANGALQDLIESGVPREDISIVANVADEDYLEAADTSQAAEGAGTGAGLGGVIGGGAGLLAGLGIITIPGLGPVVAAGWLAAMAAGLIAGAAAGAAAGGIVGALMDSGVSEDHANIYAEGIRQGGTLLTVRVDEVYADEIKNLLDAHGPVNPNTRADEYRDRGWDGFDDRMPADAADKDGLEELPRPPL